jgi:hypothetical protein
MPTVLPPQSTVVLVKVAPATHALLPLVDELELELEDELLLDEELDDELLELLEDEPPQAAACVAVPEGMVTVRLSIFTRPALLVASSRMLLMPAFRSANTVVEKAQVVNEPVAGISIPVITSTPLISNRAGRLPEAFA